MNTVMYVDILDASVEQIAWSGIGPVTVFAPDGTEVATVQPGNATGDLLATGEGSYRVELQSAQVVGEAWDLGVLGQVDSKGRVFSYDWKFNAGAFSSDRSTDASFFARVPSGGPNQSSVIELQLDGLAGYVYDINANRLGALGPDAGRSVPMAGNQVAPEFPIYLRPPAAASYSASLPGLFEATFVGGTSVDAQGDPIQPCQQVVAGAGSARFQFTSASDGTAHVQCDLNGDGEFNPNGAEDLLLLGDVHSGSNSISWDGLHDGAPILPGDYACRVTVNVGEFHYVGADIETSYPGFRLYEVHADETRSPLRAYWNDTMVQTNAQPMPNGALGLVSPGAEGLFAGPYGSPAVPNVNTRSWGNFNSGGKGNQAFLDTFTSLASTASTTMTVSVVDPQVDTDQDGAGDYEETCAFGTDPTNPDSDGDGTPDGEQYGGVASSGGGNGLESNGRLASRMARRAIRNSRVSLGPQGVVRSSSELQALLPAPGTLGVSAVEATPWDLVELTNATRVLARDYFDEGGRRVGGVLLVETQAEPYEHSKAICDRASGARLDTLAHTRVGAHKIVRATTRGPAIDRVDHFATFGLYQKDMVDGEAMPPARVHARWLRADYPAPASEDRVVTVQTWSSIPGGEALLGRAVLENVSQNWGLGPSEHPWEDEDVAKDAVMSVSGTASQLPAKVMAWGELLGGRLRVEVRTPNGDDTQVPTGEWRLRVVSLAETAEHEQVHEFEVPNDPSELQFDLGPVLDATVELLHRGVVVDQMWLSDGAWTAYDDSLWGGASRAEFSRATCTPSHDATMELRYPGCATATGRIEGSVGFGGVARHLSRPLDLTPFRSLAFSRQSERELRVCVETTSGGNYCTEVPAGQGTELVALSRLKDAQSEALPATAAIAFISFVHQGEGEFDLSISGLGLSSTEAPTTQPDGVSGCTVTAASPPNPWMALLILGLLGWRRRA